jgi:hypothetical protein
MASATHCMRPFGLACLLLAATTLTPPKAAAAEPAPSPERAAALETQLHTWLADLIGPGLALPDRPVQLTTQDAGYAVSMPLAGAIPEIGLTLKADPMTATARPLPDGRWALDDVKLPSPIEVSLNPPGGNGETHLRVTVAEQEQHAVFDPDLATTSTWDGRIGGYKAESQGPDSGTSTTDIAHIVAHLTAQPAGNGLIDVTEEANSDLIATNSLIPEVGQSSMSAAHTRVIAHMEGLKPAQVPPILHVVSSLAPLITEAAKQASLKMTVTPDDAQKDEDSAGVKAETTPKLTDAQRAAVRAAVEALTQLMSGFGEEITLDDVRFASQGIDASLRKLTFGLTLAAPEGRLRLTSLIALEGLDSPMIPDGPLRAFVPHRIRLAPRISGAPADGVAKLMLDAVDHPDDDKRLEPEARALLKHGPVAVGFDDISLDVGPSAIKAEGEVRIADEKDVRGDAKVTVTKFAALLKSAQDVPEMQEAVPFLIFLKGIGDTHGDTTVWKIDYDGKHLKVNGTDMSKMLPGK